MRPRIFLLTLFALDCVMSAQVPKEPVWTLRRRLYPKLVEIFDLAQTAPPPLRAFALLRIASSPRLKDMAWRRELIEESYTVSKLATNLWPVNPVAMPEGPRQHIADRFAKASQLNSGLDRLSLQTSAITAMISIDPMEARNLFDRRSSLDLPSLTCRNGLVPNVGKLYQMAGRVADEAFFPREKEQRKQIYFLTGVVSSIASPLEVEPVAQMLLEQHLSSEDLDTLIISYAQRLEALSPNSRAFFENLDVTSQNVQKIAGQLGKRSTALVLLKAWRTYVVANLKTTACEENVDPAFVYSRWSAETIGRFNKSVFPGSELAAIGDEEIVPKKVEEGLEADSVAPAFQEDLSKRWFALMFGNQHNGLSDDQKKTTEWKALLAEFVNAVEDLKPLSSESVSDLIWRKCGLLSQAVMVSPPGPDRDRVLSRYVSLLNVSDLQPEAVAEWYEQIRALLRLCQSISKSGAETSRVLRDNGNALINLVASIDEIESSQ